MTYRIPASKPIAPELAPPTKTRKRYPFQGTILFQGITIDVENKRGSYRKGVDGDGKAWRVKMHHHYGEVRGTKGVDGDAVDVYVGPDADSPLVVVIHQRDPVTQKYDEDKVMLGFRTEGAAVKAYRAQYNRPGFYGSHRVMTIGRFRRLLLERRGQMLKGASYAPTAAMRAAARRGLELRKKHGRGGLTTREAGRQGIGSGVARARDIAAGKSLSIATVRRMAAFFSRHEKNKSGGTDDAGYIAWQLWGGDPGRSWASAIIEQHDRGTEKARRSTDMGKGPFSVIARAGMTGGYDLGRACQVETALLKGGAELANWTDLDGVILLPEAIGDELFKGAGHKYIKRVPYVDGKGRRRYRYYYHATHGRGVDNDFHMKAGAAFKHGKGHYHILSVDGANVIVQHDETGKKFKISKARLGGMLKTEHEKAIDAHRKRIREKLDTLPKRSRGYWISQAKKYGVDVKSLRDKLQETAAKLGTKDERAKRVAEILDAKKKRDEAQAAKMAKVRQMAEDGKRMREQGQQQAAQKKPTTEGEITGPGGYKFPNDNPHAELMARTMVPPSMSEDARKKWDSISGWVKETGASADDVRDVLEAIDFGEGTAFQVRKLAKKLGIEPKGKGEESQKDGEKHQGRTWDSAEGKRTVVGQHQSGGWLVKTEGKRFPEIVQDVDAEAEWDSKKLQSKRKSTAQAAEKEKREAAEKAEREDLDGFDAGMPPRRRGTALRALSQRRGLGGDFRTVRDHMRKLVADGWRVENGGKMGRVLRSPSGSFYTQRDVGSKTALDYAEHLSKRQGKEAAEASAGKQATADVDGGHHIKVDEKGAKAQKFRQEIPNAARRAAQKHIERVPARFRDVAHRAVSQAIADRLDDRQSAKHWVSPNRRRGSDKITKDQARFANETIAYAVEAAAGHVYREALMQRVDLRGNRRIVREHQEHIGRVTAERSDHILSEMKKRVPDATGAGKRALDYLSTQAAHDGAAKHSKVALDRMMSETLRMAPDRMHGVYQPVLKKDDGSGTNRLQRAQALREFHRKRAKAYGEVAHAAAQLLGDNSKSATAAREAQKAAEADARMQVKAASDARRLIEQEGKAKVEAEKRERAAQAERDRASAADYEKHLDRAKFDKHMAALTEANKKPLSSKRIDRVGRKVHTKTKAHTRAKKFASKDKFRESLHSVKFEHGHAIATDGHRLALIPTEATATGVSHRDDVNKPQSETFPNYEKNIPKNKDMHAHVFSADQLHAKLGAIFAHSGKYTDDAGKSRKSKRPRIIKLVPTDDGKLHLTGDHRHGPGSFDQKRIGAVATSKAGGGQHEGKSIPFINAKYLKDAMQGAKGKVTIRLAKNSAAYSPIVVEREDGEKHIIMPWRDSNNEAPSARRHVESVRHDRTEKGRRPTPTLTKGPFTSILEHFRRAA